MFRELLRKKKEISKEECIEILEKEKRGVLSVIGDEGYPYGMPMNHFYNEDDGNIWFHSEKRVTGWILLKRSGRFPSAFLKKEQKPKATGRFP